MNSGETVNPAWIHRGCGGVVYARINGQQFAFHKCYRSGQLGVKIPEGMTSHEQMEYLVTQAREVDIIPMHSGYFFLGP
jgi:hypothetical protein